MWRQRSIRLFADGHEYVHVSSTGAQCALSCTRICVKRRGCWRSRKFLGYWKFLGVGQKFSLNISTKRTLSAWIINLQWNETYNTDAVQLLAVWLWQIVFHLVCPLLSRLPSLWLCVGTDWSRTSISSSGFSFSTTLCCSSAFTVPVEFTNYLMVDSIVVVWSLVTLASCS